MKYTSNNDDEQVASGQAAISVAIIGLVVAIILIIIKHA